MAPNTLPTAEFLRQCFAYGPETGILTWLPRPREHFASEHAWHTWLTRFSGRIAGSVPKLGYINVKIQTDKRRLYKAHRLIWKIMTGEEPTASIDHINRNTLDNRWDNLREATCRQNNHNRRAMGAVLIKGVRLTPEGKYMARAHDGIGRRVYLGCFDTAEAAHEAYASFIRPLRGDFYHPD